MARHPGVLAGRLQRGVVRMAILDSLSGVHVRRQADAEMLPLIKCLAELARDSGKPILLTHHPRKRTILDLDDALTLDTVRDSGAITPTALAVWVADMPDRDNRPETWAERDQVQSRGKPEPLGFAIGDAHVTFGEAPEMPKLKLPAESVPHWAVLSSRRPSTIR